MCDLGASINVMPLAIYESLNVGPLKEMGVVLQLADRPVVYPKGVLEDVLIQINELVFPADFYVLDMMGDNSPNSTSILLGRPFLKTSRTKIDIDAGTLSMEFDNEVPDSTSPKSVARSSSHRAGPSFVIVPTSATAAPPRHPSLRLAHRVAAHSSVAALLSNHRPSHRDLLLASTVDHHASPPTSIFLPYFLYHMSGHKRTNLLGL
ncbi:UNVERIFIED_CONTAM: hypothetical protein Slati_0421800 [Sesamum latifolium]|uniref:Uncharacterized protein n=1 Tax=Sesamum latifolium TaxID=2727402 RepID=A0AAW2XZX8_9LAMI